MKKLTHPVLAYALATVATAATAAVIVIALVSVLPVHTLNQYPLDEVSQTRTDGAIMLATSALEDVLKTAIKLDIYDVELSGPLRVVTGELDYPDLETPVPFRVALYDSVVDDRPDVSLLYLSIGSHVYVYELTSLTL